MTTRAQLLRYIREKCLDCNCYQRPEATFCPVYKCALYPYRFGEYPSPSRSRGFANARIYTGENPQQEVKLWS